MIDRLRRQGFVCSCLPTHFIRKFADGSLFALTMPAVEAGDYIRIFPHAKAFPEFERADWEARVSET